jgi:uncharacterized ion transporter superfamily protein YfcC
MMSTETAAPKKKFEFPHTYVVLFALIIIAAVATYFVTPGVYDRAKDERTGRTLVDPNSYHTVDRTPTTPLQLFYSVPKGMVDSAEIGFFIFICGGAFMVLQATGAIDAGLSRVVTAMRGREKLMIAGTMFIFSVLGGTMGMAEEVIVFIPIGVVLSRAVGYDNIVAIAMFAIGAAIGFSAGFMNPFTVGIAQSIAELPLFSGMTFRLIGYVFIYIAAVAYTLRYAKMIKDDPTKSYVYGLKLDDDAKSLDNVPFTTRHGLVLLILLFAMGWMLYGVFMLDYYVLEIASVFLGMAIIAGLVGGLKLNQIAEEFVIGCKDIAFGALCVGISRGILVTMQNGNIVDTVIRNLAMLVAPLPSGVDAVGMYIVQTLISFIIPSGSGMAATTMPIMTPLSDLVGITRQTAVVAFQYADGFSNNLVPTSGALMAVLAMAKVPYERWFKFMLPLFLIWTAIGGVLTFVAAVIKLA